MVLTRNDLEDIARIMEDKIKTALSDETFLNKIVHSVCIKMEETLKTQEGEIKQLNSQLEDIKRDNRKLEKEIDRNQQFSRNLNIRIFGLKQEKDIENTREVVLNLISEKMKIKSIKDNDIKKCYRIQAKNINSDIPRAPRPPAVLVRFYSDNIRAEILKNRKFLKSSGISIKEDLTKLRLALLESANKVFSKANVWSYNGNIYCKHKNELHRLEEESDINIIKSG